MTTSALTQDKQNKQKESTPANPTCDAAAFTPRFDIWETADELVLSGDLPGVTTDHLDIDFENDQLTIHGRVSRSTTGRQPLHAEYGVGDFHRSFTIGESIDGSKISAELAGGVLTVHLPKSERVKSRRIEVKSA